jgi:hypothetical protein
VTPQQETVAERNKKGAGNEDSFSRNQSGNQVGCQNHEQGGKLQHRLAKQEHEQSESAKTATVGTSTYLQTKGCVNFYIDPKFFQFVVQSNIGIFTNKRI